MSNVHVADDGGAPVLRPPFADPTFADPAEVIGSPIPGRSDEELARELAPEKPLSRKVSVLTRILAALALVSVGLVGGVLLDRHFGTSGSSGTGRGNGTLQGGFGGGFPGGGGFPTGEFRGGGTTGGGGGANGGGFAPPGG